MKATINIKEKNVEEYALPKVGDWVLAWNMARTKEWLCLIQGHEREHRLVTVEDGRYLKSAKTIDILLQGRIWRHAKVEISATPI